MYPLFLALVCSLALSAPDSVVVDNPVHRFGKVDKAGPSELSCTFVLKNLASSARTISYAVPGCSCSSVSWEPSQISAGGEAGVTVTYRREAFAGRFDKSVAVYFEGFETPIKLRITGEYVDSEASLKAEFPFRLGPFGFKTPYVKDGPVYPGVSRSGHIEVANLSSEQVVPRFVSLDGKLSVYPDFKKVAPFSRFKLRYSFLPDSLEWGLCRVPVLVSAGEAVSPDTLLFRAATVPDFRTMSKDKKAAGSYYKFASTDIRFSTIHGSQAAEGEFHFTNTSDSELKILSARADRDGANVIFDTSVAPGARSSVRVNVPSSSLTAGENVISVFLVTDSPLKPYIVLTLRGVKNE